MPNTTKRHRPAVLDRLAALYLEPSGLFHDLVAAAGLRPALDFRRRDLREMRFRNADLDGFDFSNSDLRGTGVRFSQRISASTKFTGCQLDQEDAAWLRGDIPPAQRRSTFHAEAPARTKSFILVDVRSPDLARAEEAPLSVTGFVSYCRKKFGPKNVMLLWSLDEVPPEDSVRYYSEGIIYVFAHLRAENITAADISAFIYNKIKFLNDVCPHHLHLHIIMDLLVHSKRVAALFVHEDSMSFLDLDENKRIRSILINAESFEASIPFKVGRSEIPFATRLVDILEHGIKLAPPRLSLVDIAGEVAGTTSSIWGTSVKAISENSQSKGFRSYGRKDQNVILFRSVSGEYPLFPNAAYVV